MKFMLWLDGVGGYWVSADDTVVLGQPGGSAPVDVPIMGDLSARHAQIRRDPEGYWIEPVRDVRLDGRLLTRPAALVDGCRIQLGKVFLVFRRPHGLSLTARLELASPHRTHPPSDGVLLMASTCVLGPNGQSHVVCRNWLREVVLHRSEEKLFCRTEGPLEIDGVACRERGPLTLRSRVSGQGFSFTLEPISAK